MIKESQKTMSSLKYNHSIFHRKEFVMSEVKNSGKIAELEGLLRDAIDICLDESILSIAEVIGILETIKLDLYLINTKSELFHEYIRVPL